MGLYPLTVNNPAAQAAHIYAEDDAAIYEAISGSDGVYDLYGKMEATVIDNNTVRIGDGVVCVGGHMARMKYGDYEDVTINNGASGKKRNDLIVLEFKTTGARGTDTYALKVIKGTATTGTAKDPTVTDGNLYKGKTVRQYPLYRVKIEGLSIVAVESVHEVKKTASQMQEELDSLNSKTILEAGNSESGYQHYIKYTDGRLEQWGILSVNYSNGFGQITYPIPFAGSSTKDYVLFAQSAYIAGTVTEDISAQKNSLKIGTIYSRDRSGNKIATHDVDWMAIGRWK